MAFPAGICSFILVNSRKSFAESIETIHAFVVPELNLGQVVLEVERCAAGTCRVVSVPHAGGAVHCPDVICQAIVEAAR